MKKEFVFLFFYIYINKKTNILYVLISYSISRISSVDRRQSRKYSNQGGAADLMIPRFH